MGIGYQYMRQSRRSELAETESDQQKGLPQPPLEKAAPVGAARIALPGPRAVGLAPLDFVALLEQRATLRRYPPDPLSLAELAYLLWASLGVKEVLAHSTRRTVPSAGARHAFETVVLVNAVDGLAPGLYRYLALSHELVRLEAPPDITAQVMAACLDQQQIAQSAVTLIWVADAYRMQWRYGERYIRYLHLDAGHVCQNLYLAAESIRCGVCAIAAFEDDALNALLGCDGEREFVVYLGSVGRRA
jgi:SagB-type dehydrogenase family enzyme